MTDENSYSVHYFSFNYTKTLIKKPRSCFIKNFIYHKQKNTTEAAVFFYKTKIEWIDYKCTKTNSVYGLQVNN